jgi:hypothetical protein
LHFVPEDYAFGMGTDKMKINNIFSQRERVFCNKSKQQELVLMKKCNLFQNFSKPLEAEHNS